MAQICQRKSYRNSMSYLALQVLQTLKLKKNEHVRVLDTIALLLRICLFKHVKLNVISHDTFS